jgi:acetoacetyl-CoA synthetase
MTELGEILWSPPASADDGTQLGRYLSALHAQGGRSFDGYADLQRWSVADLDGFWGSIWDFFEVRASTPYERVLGSREMPGAEWFAGSRLNYAEHMVGGEGDGGRVAVIAHSQTRSPVELTFADLREQVAAARGGLERLGVVAGDRVVAYLPNIPETLVAFLASASLGAVWAACPPEFGSRSVIDRFAMLEPKVLLAVAGYRYAERPIDRRADVAALRAGLPTVEHVVHVPYPGGADDTLPGALGWEQLLSQPSVLEFEQVPFDHPLLVMFSSGTT